MVSILYPTAALPEFRNLISESILLAVGQDALVSRLAADYCVDAMLMLPGSFIALH